MHLYGKKWHHGPVNRSKDVKGRQQMSNKFTTLLITMPQGKATSWQDTFSSRVTEQNGPNFVHYSAGVKVKHATVSGRH